ncbi:malonic semialdehyde reductase [Paucibacter sp. PLA-PC-4]|uniref:malonic semialdehyde reductase n=1 Tax=Paucibacter sp. PLA-PC-4 TaxID=2993655 RepID=UPI00224B838E|nr:malonic semialdehyde reductase [Paucibacter sp. PLA-PC-4]MCX2864343.1 malonic semialdehyde reductase [Paucibacter sp. PLA-PC-4]
MPRLDDAALDLLFRSARSHNAWLDKPVSTAQLYELYELMKLGPTSSNGSPARLVFVHSETARSRLVPLMAPGNQAKVQAAPVSVLIGYDKRFHERLPQLFAHNPGAAAPFAANPALAEATAFRNSSLQGAYLMLAARSLGLDCGPMSGFDAASVNREFFGDEVVVNFICCLGYGDPAGLFARHPRLSFDEACQVL